MAVALDLVAEGADHLAVAVVAALADVDVAARELERRIGPDALDLLDRRLDGEQRHDLDQAADRDRDQGEDQHQDDVGFDAFVAQSHGAALALFRRRRRDRRAADPRDDVVFSHLRLE